jgi:hypothetical protein
MEWDDDFLGLPIQPRFVAGLFSWQDLPSLGEFVQQHPSYHIVSIPHGGLNVNHLVRTARLFRLADGDSDPSLICIRTARYWQQWADELGERSSAKARKDELTTEFQTVERRLRDAMAACRINRFIGCRIVEKILDDLAEPVASIGRRK